MTAAEPAFQGYIENTYDALLLFTACWYKHRPTITRRLQEKERQSIIRSGAVFVFDEAQAGIKRWTDGYSWSPSRILGNFLVYRELDKRKVAAQAHPRPDSPSAVQTPSSNAASTSSTIAPPLSPPSPPHQTSSAAVSPPQTPLTATSSAASGSYTRSSAGGDMVDIPTVHPDGTEGTMTIDRQRERALVGSLTSAYNFKPGGLIKKTISLGSLHMISYYSIEDVVNARLRRPSTVDEFQSIEINEDLLAGHNFRNPPEVGSRDADGKTRIRNAAEDLASPGGSGSVTSDTATPLASAFPPDPHQSPHLSNAANPQSIRLPEGASRSRAPSTAPPHHPPESGPSALPSPPGVGRYRRQSVSSGSYAQAGSTSQRTSRYEPYLTSHSTRYTIHSRDPSASSLGLSFAPVSSSSSSSSAHGSQEWGPSPPNSDSVVFGHPSTQSPLAMNRIPSSNAPATAQPAGTEQPSYETPGAHYRSQVAQDVVPLPSYPPYAAPLRPSHPQATHYAPPHVGTSLVSSMKVEESNHASGSLYPTADVSNYPTAYYPHSSQVYNPHPAQRHAYPPAARFGPPPGHFHSGGTDGGPSYATSSASQASAYPHYNPMTAFPQPSGSATPQPSGMVVGVESAPDVGGTDAHAHGHAQSHPSGQAQVWHGTHRGPSSSTGASYAIG